jgi:hypothetical protein
MGTRRRTDRAAAVVLAAIGLAMLAFVAIAVAEALPRMRGDEGEHAAGEAVFSVILVLSPVVVGGLLTLLVARRLWWGRPMGRAFAGVWTAAVGFACVLMAAANWSALHAARVVLFEAGLVSFRWPVLGVQPASFEDGPYYYRVDEIWFWMPAILAVGALLVAGLLLAGRFAERARDAGTG